MGTRTPDRQQRQAGNIAENHFTFPIALFIFLFLGYSLSLSILKPIFQVDVFLEALM